MKVINIYHFQKNIRHVIFKQWRFLYFIKIIREIKVLIIYNKKNNDMFKYHIRMICNYSKTFICDKIKCFDHRIYFNILKLCTIFEKLRCL